MTKLTLALYLILACFVCEKTEAQQPISRKKADPELIAYFDKCLKSEIASVPNETKSSIKEYLYDTFRSRHDMEIDMVNAGDLIVNSPIQDVLDSLLAGIVKANNIERPLRIFLNADLSANAFATGDGNLFINIGLLVRLHSIEELTFVICHEITHDLKEHLRIQTKQRAEYFASKSFKQDLKKLKKAEFGQRALYERIVGSALSNTRKFSRAYEFEADSIGMNMFLALGHSREPIYSVLRILETVDKEPSTPIVDFRTFLTVPNFEIDNIWFGKEESSFGSYKYVEPELPDSLKTHPDIPVRISHLSGKEDITSISASEKIDPKYFPIQNLAEKECIFTWYNLGNYGRTIYYACRLDLKQSSSFTQSMIALCFGELVQAKRIHQLGYHVAMNSSGYSDNYNECLHILNEMTGKDMYTFAERYLSNKEWTKSKTPTEIEAASLFITNYNVSNEMEWNKWAIYYLDNFPNGFLAEQIKSIKQ